MSQPKGCCSHNAKQEQLEQFKISHEGKQETSQFGAKINNEESLKAGLEGPTLMEDFMMREKIMHFGSYNINYFLKKNLTKLNVF